MVKSISSGGGKEVETQVKTQNEAGIITVTVKTKVLTTTPILRKEKGKEAKVPDVVIEGAKSEENNAQLEENNAQLEENNAQLEGSDKLKNLKREIAAEVLGIPADKNWEIVDSTADLVMLHYTDRADPNKYGYIRGIVISIKWKIVVANSYGYTPTAVANHLLVDENGNIVIQDTEKRWHHISLNNTDIKYGLEGVMIRVFQWGGRVYYVSHRKFDLSNSRWGDSMPFKQIYDSLGGPKDDELFSPEERSSPFVYFFLAEHIGLLHVTKNKVLRGFLYYLGYRMMNTLIYSGSTNAGEKRTVCPPVLPRMRNCLPTIEEEATMNFNNERPCPIQLANLTVGQSNTLLRFGYLNYRTINDDLVIDPRLRTGEFIVLYKPDGTLLRVESPAYYWRAKISNDNPNRAHRFYQLLDWAKIQPYGDKEGRKRWVADLYRFRQTFPPMCPYPTDEIENMLKKGPIYIWDTRGISRREDSNHYYLCEIASFKQRLYNIWACLLLASPYNRQLEVVKLYQRFFIDRDRLIEWATAKQQDISGQNSEEVDNPLLIYSKRLREIIAMASGGNKDKAGLKDNMHRLLIQEYGESLYRLVKEMKFHESYEMKEKDQKLNDENHSVDNKVTIKIDSEIKEEGSGETKE